AQALAGCARHYTYISTISVYAYHPAAGVTEHSPVLDCPPDATGTVDSLGYGELKAGSERAAGAAFPGKCLIVRPGLIVGPHENVRWLTWWLERVARGGTVLAPGGPGKPGPVTRGRDPAALGGGKTTRGPPPIVQ